MRAMNFGKAAALALTVVWAAGCSTTNTTDTGSMGDSTATTATSKGSGATCERAERSCRVGGTASSAG